MSPSITTAAPDATSAAAGIEQHVSNRSGRTAFMVSVITDQGRECLTAFSIADLRRRTALLRRSVNRSQIDCSVRAWFDIHFAQTFVIKAQAGNDRVFAGWQGLRAMDFAQCLIVAVGDP